MRSLAFACALVLSASSADACGKGPFAVEGWELAPAGEGFVKLSAEIRLEADRSVRMVKGTIWFSDALDRLLGGIPLDPDLSMAPGTRATVQAHQPIGRFLKVVEDDIRVVPCITAVVYEDGSVERF